MTSLLYIIISVLKLGIIVPVYKGRGKDKPVSRVQY